MWTEGTSVSLSVNAAHGLGSVILMGLPAVTHGIDTSARRLVLPITSTWVPGSGAVGVQVPSVAKAPAGHYYAIALDSRGVPSEARIVQVVSSGAAAAAATGIAAPQPESAPLGVSRAVAIPGAPEED